MWHPGLYSRTCCLSITSVTVCNGCWSQPTNLLTAQQPAPDTELMTDWIEGGRKESWKELTCACFTLHLGILLQFTLLLSRFFMIIYFLLLLLER